MLSRRCLRGYILRDSLPTTTLTRLGTRYCGTTKPDKQIRVRYAPSPTGSLHLGGLRTALYNYIFAKKHGGKCLLRVEDTDRTRLVPGAVDQLLRDLDWSGLHFDEGPEPIGGNYGPYTQSERLPIYTTYADQLIESGHAYRCFCTAERLDELRKNQATRGVPTVYDKLCSHLSQEEVEQRLKQNIPHVVRMRVPESGNTVVNDAIRGDIVFQNRVIDDQVLVKSDGFPTYHLANIVDDHLMEITHVIRGEEWVPSSGKHVLLYKMFGWEPPVFAHLPLLLREDGSKLSKRFKDSSLDYYIKKGYLPEAIINFVALLGWHPPNIIKEETTAQTIPDFNDSSLESLRAALDADIPTKKAKAKKAKQDSTYTDSIVQVQRDEMMTITELIDLFSLEKVQKGGAAVELHKLQYFHNQYYMQLLQNNIERLISFVQPHVINALHIFQKNKFDTGVDIMTEEQQYISLLNNVKYKDLVFDPSLLKQEKVSEEIRSLLERALKITHDHPCLLPEFPYKVFFMFARPDLTQGTAVDMYNEVWVHTPQTNVKTGQSKPNTEQILESVIAFLQTLSHENLSTPTNLVALFKEFTKQQGITLRELYLPLRYTLSGSHSGPGVADQIISLGRDEAILRIQNALTLHKTTITPTKQYI